MAKFGSASVVFLVGGFNYLAAKVKTLSHKFESLTEEDWGLGDNAVTHCPVGVSRLTLTQSGAFFDTTANSSHTALVTQPTTPAAVPKVVCLGVAGNLAGAPFEGISGDYTHSYEVLGELSGLTKANGGHAIKGKREPGQIIQPLEVKTVDWDTEGAGVDNAVVAQRVIPITSNSQASPTVVTTPVPHGLTTGQVIVISGVTGSDADVNGERTVTVLTETTFSVPVNAGTAPGTGGSLVLASTVAGGAGYLQVTAASGFTNFVGKIRDSADDLTYSDLVTFADNVAAPFAERVEVAGTVDRYLAFDGNVTGSGSITAFAGFSRF